MSDGVIDPTHEQLAALAAAADEGPVLMLNLLTFREDGRAHYRRYMAVAQRAVAEVGGSLVLMGAAAAPFIGPQDDTWDEVLIVRYPSREAFLRMLSFDYYREALVHRTNALRRSRIYPLVEK